MRRPPIAVPGGAAVAGSGFAVRVDLPVGSWQLEAPYTSHLPVEVKAPGLSTELPANLDRLGPRWPIGRLTVRRRRPFSISFQVEDILLAPGTATTNVGYVLATPVEDVDRIVPIARACGKYVDWYRSAR